MTLRAASINAITLARMTPSEYQVTYWRDGVARFDGRSGQRRGAWEARVDQTWFTRASKLARNLQPGWVSATEASVTLVLDMNRDRFIYDASETDEPQEFWTLSTIIEGMCQRTRWSPMDTSGAEDFSRFGAATPIWMAVGEATATGFGLNGAVLVLAGAQASTSTYPSLQEAYQELRSDLIDAGDLILEKDRFRLGRHLLFTSPSAAASVLVGSNTSGRRAWRDSAGRAWSELGLDG
jgi:hypothetical protein